VTDRKKWKDLVRQAKAHSGLQCQWRRRRKKKKRKKKKKKKMLCRIQAYMTFREWALFLCSRLLTQALPKQSNYRIFSISKYACFPHSKFSEIRARLTFDGIKE
jgi:uncharacterized Rmd1/YagE family protein